jgi:type IV secretory pathway VirB3-like protein
LSDSPELPYGHAALFPALTQPMMTSGIPDRIAVSLWVGVAGFCSILGQYRIALLGIVLHFAGVAIYKWDPFAIQVYRRSKRYRVGSRLNP